MMMMYFRLVNLAIFNLDYDYDVYFRPGNFISELITQLIAAYYKVVNNNWHS